MVWRMLQQAAMKIATWNVNSIRARHDRALAWLAKVAPDVLCLQELKVTDEAFDHAPFEALGYHVVTHGQKTYNGVAILSKMPPSNVQRSLDDSEQDTQARLVAATVSGVRILSAYFPNGGELGSDKYAYKLRWMTRLRDYLDRHHDPDEPLVLCGDFNVAPDDLDVAQPETWADSTLCHPEVRDALARIAAFGLTDLFRPHHREGHVYSWWDYRMLAFPKGNGLRIDHIFGTTVVAGRCHGAWIDRDERKGKSPSDHAPVIVELTADDGLSPGSER